MTRPRTLADCPFTCRIQVRFADVDAMNHVNNAVYVTYLETARTCLWRERLAFRGSARDVPFIVAHVAVDFRSPIAYEDEVTVGIAASHVGRTSFRFVYRIEASGRLAAEAETVLVAYDYAAGKPKPLSDSLRTALTGLLIR
jgi:acyl-CoA thioester hydrolase